MNRYEFTKIKRKCVNSNGDNSATWWPNGKIDQRSNGSNKMNNNNFQTLRTGEAPFRSKNELTSNSYLAGCFKGIPLISVKVSSKLTILNLISVFFATSVKQNGQPQNKLCSFPQLTCLRERIFFESETSNFMSNPNTRPE